MITAILITGYRSKTITVTSDLTGEVFYHWYVDGDYKAVTRSNQYSYYVPVGQQFDIQIIDTLDFDFDPVSNAPVEWPAYRTIWWVRGDDEDPVQYAVEQNKAAAGWTDINIVPVKPNQYQWELRTQALDDDTSYQFGVTGIDAAGNRGTRKTVLSELIVRKPNAPDNTISFSDSTQKVTFTLA